MALLYKYTFKLPDELKGVDHWLDLYKTYTVYAASEKEARKFAKERAKEEHNVKLRAPLVLLHRERW